MMYDHQLRKSEIIIPSGRQNITDHWNLWWWWWWLSFICIYNYYNNQTEKKLKKYKKNRSNIEQGEKKVKGLSEQSSIAEPK